MKTASVSLFLFLVFLHQGILSAQEKKPVSDSLIQKNTSVYKALGLTSAYYAGSLYVLGKTWYKGRDRVPFHFYNDNKGYLQVDKCGHIFGAYVYSYTGFHFLLKSGYSRRDALFYGASLGLILQTPVEIMDGIYEGYGFSWGDMAANSLGSLLVIGQELLFREQWLKFKFSYWGSPYAHMTNGYLGTNSFNRIFNDYNGHSYWLSFPVNILLKHDPLPGWLNIAVGYGANGMFGEFENIREYNGVMIPPTERYRQYLLSPDIDWTRIQTNSEFLAVLFRALNFIKLPFPALEYNSKGRVRGYWMYY